MGNLSMFLNWEPSIIRIYTVDAHFGVTYITFPVCIHKFTRAKVKYVII